MTGYGTPQGDGQPQYAVPQHGAPVWGGPYPPVQNSQDAVIALVAAIASWVICPVIPAIVALVFAKKAEQAIAGSRGALGGQGMVTGARIIAWIHLGLVAAFLAVVLVLVVGLGVVSS